ncbi:rRNA N(6)-adenosine-methyltransferase ZCCHC4-like [Ptychodera flava]|uniref:rRNA N(6)-adenosine-methyltransferase ZCCHC4-like n=1 Tax=Ptychodera flava TaxID=63121 RepID=UPI00396A5A1C
MSSNNNRFGDTSLGVDVVLDEDIMKNAPHCPHGPTLLFERYFQGGKSGRKFFACSACRDRKDCNFFQYEDDKVSAVRQEVRYQHNQSKQPPFKHLDYYKRYKDLLNLPPCKRCYCHECSLLLVEEEAQQGHKNHRVITGLSEEDLKKPSYLLDPLVDKKTNAQYLFNQNAVTFLVSTIQRLGFNRVLCIGTPRLHEMILSLKGSKDDTGLESLLLDIDHRYYQFYSPEHFSRYNMFNHYFFDGEGCQKNCQEFLNRDGGEGVVMVTDPPFGGLVEVLAFTVKRIMGWWKEGTSDSCSSKELPVIWTFPYFLEFRILQCLPSFHMSDYKVAYDNHTLFQCDKTNKGSPVRHFTNISPIEFVLPEEEGYRFCVKCQRYVSSVNVHCLKCDQCTSKDGRTYTHCDQCSRCVKPGRVHCSSCNQCELPDHVCVTNKALIGCHICGDPTHKRRQCPQTVRSDRLQKKRKHHNPSQGHLLDPQSERSSNNIKKTKRPQPRAVDDDKIESCKHRWRKQKCHRNKRRFKSVKSKKKK